LDNIKESRQGRRDQAITRQKAHDSLTLDQKIQKAKARRGLSSKELARLTVLREEAIIEKAKRSNTSKEKPSLIG